MTCGSIAFEVDMYVGGFLSVLPKDVVIFFWKNCYLLT